MKKMIANADTFPINYSSCKLIRITYHFHCLEDESLSQRTICKRLRRGDDLLIEIKKLAEAEDLKAAVVLSCVGCVMKAKVRDAGGVEIQEIPEEMEIISVQGTVSAIRSHLHIGFSKKDLSMIGGHLVEGCIINTTCEIVLLELDNWSYDITEDEETGYDEIVFVKM